MENETTLATRPNLPEASAPATSAPEQASGAVVNEAQEIALSLADKAQGFLEGLLRPWNAYQIVIALVLFIVAHLLAKLLRPRYREWMRSRENWPKWRLRFMLLVERRLRLICFVLLIFPTVWLMRELTWPSRSYLLGVIANLALAWLVIAIVTRLINNGFLRSLVRYAGWAWATLVILGITEEAISLMDTAAIELGTLRL